MTIDEYLKKQTDYDSFEYVGEIDGVQLYTFFNKSDVNARTGFPYFVTDDNGKFQPVTDFKKILKYNKFYNNSFPDDPEERK